METTYLQILSILAYCLVLLIAFFLARIRERLYIAGLFILLTLLLPPSRVVDNGETALDLVSQILRPGWLPFQPLPIWISLLQLLLFFLPVIVFFSGAIMALVLFSTGRKLYKERAGALATGYYGLPALRNKDDRFAGLSLVMSGLIVFVSLYSFYWAIVWDNTTDSIGILWLAFSVLMLITCGILIISRNPGRDMLTGLLCAILIPGLLIGVHALAIRVDYRALTEARAARVSRAIETYYAREGRYPESLEELSPWFLLTLPQPVVIGGQDWCYNGDEDGYVFGYVDREHWSSPELFSQLYSTGGLTSDLPALCGFEIANLRAVRGW